MICTPHTFPSLKEQEVFQLKVTEVAHCPKRQMTSLGYSEGVMLLSNKNLNYNEDYYHIHDSCYKISKMRLDDKNNKTYLTRESYVP